MKGSDFACVMGVILVAPYVDKAWSLGLGVFWLILAVALAYKEIKK